MVCGGKEERRRKRRKIFGLQGRRGRDKEYEENIWMRKTFSPRGKGRMEKEN